MLLTTRALHPVRQAGPVLACPSDTAGWLDTVEHYDPEFGVSLVKTWGTDWPDRWTVGRVTAAGHLTTPVAGTGTSMFEDAESVRRMTNRYDQANRSGIAYLVSTDRHHAFESLTERTVLRHIDLAQPVDVVTQPFWLHWHDGSKHRKHAPDILVREQHGTTIVNVRPDGLVKERDEQNFAALSAVAAHLGWRHAVVSAPLQPHGANVDAMSSARRDPYDPLGLGPQMRAALAQGAAAFGELVEATVAPVLARAVLLGMLWRGEAAADLAVLLSDRSAVRLGTAR